MSNMQMDPTAADDLIQAAPPTEKRLRSWRAAILLTLLIGVLLLVAAPIVVCGVPARGTAQRNACINNLRVIDAAKEQWALATQAAAGTPVTTNAINKYIPNAPPACPMGGTYTYGNIDDVPRCSIKNHALARPQSDPKNKSGDPARDRRF